MTKTRKFGTACPAALALIAATLLASCAGQDRLSTGSLPDDYRTRHPIVVGEKEKTIDIPIATGQGRLTRGQQEVIAGFASEFAQTSTGVIQVLVPAGAANSNAAHAAAREIRSRLRSMGISPDRVIERPYDTGGYGEASPIRLTYVTIAANVEPCGQWPEDMTLNTSQNKNYYNFGCASQSNLAAQIANPNDLLGPRRMTPADAAQREQGIDRYREAVVELKDLSDN